MYKFAIFVQARLTSTRLPEKVFMKLNETSMLWNVLWNCKETGIQTFLVVPDAQEKRFREELGLGPRVFSRLGCGGHDEKNLWVPPVKVGVGSENNVLERFWSVAKEHEVENIVRITGDCPFISTQMILFMIEKYREKKVEFLSNVEYKSQTATPDGFDIEIFSFNALDLAYRNARHDKDREHVTSWMRDKLRSAEVLRDVKVVVNKEYMSEKVSIDTYEELEKARKKFEVFSKLEFE